MSPAPSTFKWVVELPTAMDRDGFIAAVWREFQDKGLLGIHEGTLLTDQAVEAGFETEPWIVDQGLAPEHRDWISELPIAHVEIHADQRSTAEHIRKFITKTHPELIQHEIEELEAQDWDAEWKKNFQGIQLEPNWWVLPPWKKHDSEVTSSGRRLLFINPGAGFGTGTHPTTQLCLEVISHHWDEIKSQSKSQQLQVLDFGSGSGILSIGAAILGGHVLGCEIDELANDNARENASLNAVENKLSFQTEFPTQAHAFDLLIANILKPILLEYCDKLIRSIKPGSPVVLSGLIEPDLAEIIPTYQKALGLNYRYQIHSKDEWRAVYWWKHDE